MFNTWKYYYITLLLFFLGGGIFAQHKYLPLNNQTNIKIQKELAAKKNLGHTSMRPYLESDQEVSRANMVFIDSGKYNSKPAYLLF